MIALLRKRCVDLFGGSMDPNGSGTTSTIERRTLRTSILLAALTAFTAAALHGLWSPYLAAINAATGLMFVAAYVYFQRTENYLLVTRVVCAIAFICIFLVNIALGGISSPVASWFVLPAMASALVVGWNDGWIWLIAGCIASTSLFIAESFGWLLGIESLSAPIGLISVLYVVGFCFICGTLISFWAARHRDLEQKLNSSLRRSNKDALMAQLMARSAEAANGSMAYSEAARLVLDLICEARQFSAAHIWMCTSDGCLRSTGIWVDKHAAKPQLSEQEIIEQGNEDICAAIAARASSPKTSDDLGADPRFGADQQFQTYSVLAWPVNVDGAVAMVLEFFSVEAIELDPELHTILDYVSVQLTHVHTRERMRLQTEQMAFTDPVTRMPNRTGFDQLFTQKLKDAKRENQRLALVFIDLDGFKRVNDSLGHAIGDRLLFAIGERLSKHVRESDLAAKLAPDEDTVAARLGGDEFTIVLSNIGDDESLTTVTVRLLEVIAEPVDLGFQTVNVGASIGVAVYPDDALSLSDLMRLADAAMYEAKAIPGNQFRFATPALNDALQRRLWVESELLRAIRQNELSVGFSPIVGARSGRVIGNEIALRWFHRDGEIPFHEFFAVAETSGLMPELGFWVIEQACQALQGQRKSGFDTAKICLDISLLQLQQPLFVENLATILERYDYRDASLEFEFSDTSAILKHESCRKNIRALHEMGIRIVLDRFGTGYSSLMDFAELPIWRVKLDRKFIDAVNLADSNRSMSRAIIAMAHSMGVEVTAFGVHSEAQAQALRELGADALQGRFFGGISSTPYGHAGKPRALKLVDSSDGEHRIPA